ncbi:MAG: hypothetical protein NTV68_00090 [Methanomicrobiales archaeon]|nr:hypothetical protein [Methanomicrobiales archaeon]
MPEDEKRAQKNAGAHPDACARDSGSMLADELQNEITIGITIERIVDLTGEFCHLNELVTLHIDKQGGFTNPDTYLAIVQPVLDRLEVEIRTRYRSGMNTQQVKRIISDWIDREIAQL